MSDMMNSFVGEWEEGRSSSSFDLALEPLEHARPAAVDRPAHGLAPLRAHLFEFAVFQFDARGVRTFGGELHLDLGTDRFVWLPLAVDVPGHHKARGWLPDDDLADFRLRAVFCQFVPAAAEMRFHDSRLHRHLADAFVARPPAAKPGREDVECMGCTCIDANALAHRRHLYLFTHLPLPFSTLAPRSTSA